MEKTIKTLKSAGKAVLMEFLVARGILEFLDHGS
jgi:hypothetical protein